jgi:putative aldouronate transport system permease protein
LASTPIPRRRRQKVNFNQVFVHTLLIMLALACFLPFLLVLSSSLTSEQSVIEHGYRFLPTEFSIDAYRVIFSDPRQILNSYRVSFVVTIVGTVLGLLLTSSLAYVISRKNYWFRKPISFLVFFTMLFNGGIVPLYILITRYLHLRDSLWALILPGLVAPFFVLLLRTYFAGLPEELFDAARMDGAGEFRLFTMIALPLARPALATVALFYILNYWNDWYSALLFIDKRDELVPLQYMLYKIMANLQVITSLRNSVLLNIPETPLMTIRMAMAIIAAGPVTLVFLLVQKYFVQGLTIGAFKGGDE